MDKNTHRISYFLQKYLDGDIQEEELSLLRQLLEESDENEVQAAFDLIWNNTPLADDDTVPFFSDMETAALLQNIIAHAPVTNIKTRRKVVAGYALVAYIAGALLTLAWLYLNQDPPARTGVASVVLQKMEHDVDPAQEIGRASCRERA